MTPNRRSLGPFDRRLQQFIGSWPFGYQTEFTTLQLCDMCEKAGFRPLDQLVRPRRIGSSNTSFLRLISRMDGLVRLFDEDWGFYSYIAATKPH